jgi:anti-sigma regulatory factor (Ser/Thr protein kinase)
MDRRTAELSIPPDPRTLRDLRTRTRAVLQGWGLPEPIVDNALVAAHELSSNALLHTKADATLRLILAEDRLRIEVSDLSVKEPRRMTAEPGELERGLGLNVVANLADTWGHHPSLGGKTVWCELFVETPHPAIA